MKGERKMSKEMKVVKERLFAKHGMRCEVCGRILKRRELTGHHIIMKCRGGKITEDNILIACYDCHFGWINHIKYDSEEYWELMNKSLEHRNNEPTF